jgi:hypothetical protein
MFDELEKPVGQNVGLLFHHIVPTVFDDTTRDVRGQRLHRQSQVVALRSTPSDGEHRHLELVLAELHIL